MYKKITAIFAMSALIGGIAHADKVVQPTPELQAAVQKITDSKITKVETGRSGITSTFEVEFTPTAANGVKEIEVSQKDFKVVNAEGSVMAGMFNPGHGVKSLTELSAAVQKHPTFTANKWELEKTMTGKWVYEVSGVENGIEKEYQFDATNLALLKTEDD